jgi:hypothetical protein
LFSLDLSGYPHEATYNGYFFSILVDWGCGRFLRDQHRECVCQTFVRSAARFSDRRRIKLEQSHQKLRQAAELVLSIPDGVVLLSLQEVKLALAAVASLTFCILLILLLFFVSGVDRVLVFVALPVLLVAALVCMHASAKKAALLRLVNRMRGQAEV